MNYREQSGERLMPMGAALKFSATTAGGIWGMYLPENA